MNSQHTRKPSTSFGLMPSAQDWTAAAERFALVALLREHLATAGQLQQYVHSLEVRLRNVSFVDVRELFHRIGAATEQCAVFLDERIRDLGGAMQLQRHVAHALKLHQDDRWHELSFAACIDQISLRTHTLMGFAAQAKRFMDRAVINGDYNSLHVMTDCVYQISQLVALIQIHLPVDALAASGRVTEPLAGRH